MSKLGELFSDDYNFETLVVPAMVIAIPIMVVLGLFGLNINWLVGFAVLGIQVLLFPLWLMTSWIRDAGKDLEKRLFKKGMPTNVALGLSDGNGYNSRTKRQRIEAVTGVALANDKLERDDPAEAEARIADAVAVAREKMRDPMKFKLLRRELKSYGFWRNLVACKPIGLWTAASCSVISIGGLWLSDSKKLPLACLTCSVAMLIYWLIVIKDAKVLKAAERYSNQFFNSLATLL